MLAAHLLPVLETLRKAFPQGVPPSDYMPLLVVLRDGLSEEDLAAVVAELMDSEIVIVDNDAAVAVSSRRPPDVEVRRVRGQLSRVGWMPDELP